MRRLLLSVAAFGSALALASTAEAAATTTVGQLFTPTGNCSGDFTDIQTGAASGTSYTVPFAGFIVSWSFQDGATAVTNLKLKVARPAGAGSFTIVSEATAGPQTPNAVNTFQTQIRVGAGDMIGIHAGPGGDCVAGGTSADTNVFAPGDVPAGTTAAFSSDSHARFPVSAQLSSPCVVPKLKGRRLKADRKSLRAAGCRLGKVKGHGKNVKKQSVKPGTVLPPDSTVNVKLG